MNILFCFLLFFFFPSESTRLGVHAFPVEIGIEGPRESQKRSDFGLVNAFHNFDPNAFVQEPTSLSSGQEGPSLFGTNGQYNVNGQQMSGGFDPNAFTMQMLLAGRTNTDSQSDSQKAGSTFDPNNLPNTGGASYSPDGGPITQYNPNGEPMSHYDPNEFSIPEYDPKTAVSVAFNKKTEGGSFFDPHSVQYGGQDSSSFMGITQSPIQANWDGSWPGNSETGRASKAGKGDSVDVGDGEKGGDFGISERTTKKPHPSSWDGGWPEYKTDRRTGNKALDSWNAAMSGSNANGDANSKAADSWNAAMSGGKNDFSEKATNSWNNAIGQGSKDKSTSSELEKVDQIIEHLMSILARLSQK